MLASVILLGALASLPNISVFGDSGFLFIFDHLRYNVLPDVTYEFHTAGGIVIYSMTRSFFTFATRVISSDVTFATLVGVFYTTKSHRHCIGC